MGQMKKIIACILCVGLLCLLTACKDDSEQIDVTFEKDLTLEVLQDILEEKGDALLATDIPEEYGYIFQAVGVVPQIMYPITEEITFSILPISEGKNMLILTVKTGETTSLDYVGATDILEYIHSQNS